MNNLVIDKIADGIVGLTKSDKLYSQEHEKLCYEKNREALNKYKFWIYPKLPSYEETLIIIKKCGNDTYLWKRKDQLISGFYTVTRTDKTTRRFFEDLEKPLLVRNEMNTYHYEYLNDNIRRSDDYGDDNHIYMYYESLELFLAFLHIDDITRYLSQEKFIFILGEEGIKNHYPLDFSLFGIDYKNIKRKPLGIDEINRLFANLAYFPAAGNDFTYGILDFHKNLLTMGQRGIPDFAFLYIIYFSKKTIQEFENDYRLNTMDSLVHKAISIMLGDSSPVWTDIAEDMKFNKEVFWSSLHELWSEDRIPNELEWMKLLYLGYSLALNRNFSSRIIPAIMFNTHWNVKFSDVRDNRTQLNLALISKFKYHAMIVPFRYPIVSSASMMSHPIRDNYVKETKSNSKNANFIDEFINKYILDFYFKRAFIKADEKKELYRMVRLEDLKLHTKATLISLCEFFDIEWDDKLLEVTYDGHEAIFDLTSGYDPAPVYKTYYDVCNPFDYYRLEVVMSKYWRHWGYKPRFYKEEINYKKDDILKMFELPFQCEEAHITHFAKSLTKQARKRMNFLLEMRMSEGNVPVDNNGEEMNPIPWLKPKMELIEGKLYE